MCKGHKKCTGEKGISIARGSVVAFLCTLTMILEEVVPELVSLTGEQKWLIGLQNNEARRQQVEDN